MAFQYVSYQEKVFDPHLTGESAVKAYLLQVDPLGQQVAKFDAIHRTRKGKLKETRKNSFS